MKKSGLFITFEGADGVGKSTQVERLARWLIQKGFAVRVTREPGGGPFAEKIRAVLLDPSTKIESLTELFLYETARIEHLNKIVLPELKKGKIVLCDRFTDATVAYQGFGRGLQKEARLLNRIATKGLEPDLTVLLDLPTHQSFKKAKRRNGKKGLDRLEREGVAFQRKVRQGYLALAKEFPRRIKKVAVQKTIEETQELIRRIVAKKLS